jgi:hypothetical protein
MAVDYTKVFTVLGSYVDKVRDYYGYVATYGTDRTAIEGILSAQSLVRLENELTEEYEDFKGAISEQIDVLIDRCSTVLTDETLIGANFSFGTSPSLDIVFPALIHDMATNDKNVVASVSGVGSITYDTVNSTVGVLTIGTKLDGVTPPMAGALAIPDYAGLTTQLTPDSETITFTCIQDSESGGTRGAEIFEITGTGPSSTPYSPDGESIGSLGSIQVSDLGNSSGLVNGSFDIWDATGPTGWTIDAGTIEVDFDEHSEVVYGTDSSFRTIQANGSFSISQVLNKDAFTRLKAYWFGAWAAKDTDVESDQAIDVDISDDNGTITGFTLTPTTTSWEHTATQFVIPAEIVGDLVLTISAALPDTNDAVVIDKVTITECEYHAGLAFAIFSGPDKFLTGDKISVPISNNVAGKFQSFFRKAYKVQLPTDATPTISDALVT